jgi:hypothetical protein
MNVKDTLQQQKYLSIFIKYKTYSVSKDDNIKYIAENIVSLQLEISRTKNTKSIYNIWQQLKLSCVSEYNIIGKCCLKPAATASAI